MSKLWRSIHSQSGFTIIELMIATLVFSTVLLLCATGLISIGRMYQSGNTSRATQEVSRNVIDIIKNDFEFSGGSYTAFQFRSGVGDTNAFCIGNNLYAYELNRKIDPDYEIGSDKVGHALVLSTGSTDCGLAGSGTPFPRTLNDVVASGGRELLGTNMRLVVFTTKQSPAVGTANSLSIKVGVAKGDDDLLNPDGSCKTGAGREYCGVSVLETYATKRVQ